jgi:transketolase
MAYALWNSLLRHNPENPHWPNRDRFVLSAGHGSALLYALLHLTGYDLSLEDIQRFRQWGSKTPGHPERGRVPGVEVTTGPLGQGFANAVGMAIAEAHLGALYNRADHRVVDHMTYVLASDGDLMEGVSSEAASLAGHLKLGKLICLYDNNHVTLAAGTDMTFTEDRAARFRAYGWHTAALEDGNDLAAIGSALEEAVRETARPSLILVHTHIGFGSPHRQDTCAAHGTPLGPAETLLTKQALGWTSTEPFFIPPAAAARLGEARARGARHEAQWRDLMNSYAARFPEAAQELERRLAGELPPQAFAGVAEFPADAHGMATRVASGLVMNSLASEIPSLFGGSADLDTSTYTILKDQGDFNPPFDASTDRQGSAGGGWNAKGRNLHFGVREHAMGAVTNGLCAHGGLRPFGAGFLVFSDYMRPPIRLAALMGLPVIHVFTHDSIAVGEDGPTHQPIEQLANLRAIPDLTVIRPGDANETAVAWQLALETKDRPVILVLTRQNVPTLDRRRFAAAAGLRRGAYVLADPPQGQIDLILIACGSELGLILRAAEQLATEGVSTRCVSMPSWDLFEALPRAERELVFPPAIRARLAVEMGVAQGWHRYVGTQGDVLGLARFGASAPGPVVVDELGFTVENVCAKARALL